METYGEVEGLKGKDQIDLIDATKISFIFFSRINFSEIHACVKH